MERSLWAYLSRVNRNVTRSKVKCASVSGVARTRIRLYEKMAERSATSFRSVKWAQIILSALTTGGAVGVVFDKASPYFPYATAILAIALLILNSYAKDLDPGQKAQKHRDTASDIWNIREAYLSLLADMKDPSIVMDSLRDRRDNLQAQLYKIYHAAPHTTGSAYGEAQDALKNQEELTFFDAEIDAFLPEPLKRIRKSIPSTMTDNH